jgi:hypothetical protein
MAAAIDPSLHRNRCDRPLAEIPESTVAQQALYQPLQLKVSDPTAAFADGFPMPEGWWQFVHESELACVAAESMGDLLVAGRARDAARAHSR